MPTSAEATQPPSTSEEAVSQPFGFILTPGSSLHPTFLLAVDGTLACLLLVFVGLAFVASSSARIHVFALIGIELALWASIKW